MNKPISHIIPNFVDYDLDNKVLILELFNGDSFESVISTLSVKERRDFQKKFYTMHTRRFINQGGWVSVVVFLMH